MTLRMRAIALLCCAVWSLPVAALAAVPVTGDTDTSTVAASGLPDATELVTSEAPRGLKEYVAEHSGSDPLERVIVYGLMGIMTVATAAFTFVMTRTHAEVDRMAVRGQLAWMRERLNR